MSVLYKFRHRSRSIAPQASAANGANLARDEEPSASPSETQGHDNYTVGYGKPPTHTRFRKGRSGNPRGRPKKVRNLQTDLDEAMEHIVTVRLADKRRHVTTQSAMIWRQAEKALQGDTKAAKWLIDLRAAYSAESSTAAKNATGPDGGTSLDATDRAILEAYRQRIL